MSQKLSDEEIISILETYADLESINKVDDEMEYSRSTCEKYIRRAKNNELGIDTDLPDDLAAFYATFHGEDDAPDPLVDPRDEVADILEEFFEDVGNKSSLREKTMNFLVVEEAREHGVIPTATELFQEILSGTTGVDNQTVAKRIVSRYERMVRNNATIQRNLQRGDIRMGTDDMGRYSGSPWGGSPNAGGMADFNQPMQSGQSMPGMGTGSDPMMMMFQQMQQQIADLQEELRRDRQRGGDDILKEKTEQFLEHRLEQLIEAETTAEQEAIVQELRALRGQMEQGGAQTPVNLGENWRADLIELARTDQIDFEQAKEILQEVGEVETDPRVLEKKYEKEIEEKRIDAESDRYNKLATALETASEHAGKAFGEALVSSASGNEADDAEADDAEPQRDEPDATVEVTPEQPPPAPDGGASAPAPTVTEEGDPCEHCGTPMVQAPAGSYCPNCDYAVMGCDVCGEIVEVPPIGEANYGGCPSCEEIIELPDGTTGGAECDGCGWAGSAADVAGEYLHCEGCGNHRPISRMGDASLDDLMELAD